jgi:hypothetical protein
VSHFGQYQPDQVLKYLHTNAIQSAVEAFSTADPNRQVKAIDIRLFDPGLQFVRHGLRAADHQRAEAADTQSCKSAASLSKSTVRGPCAKNCSAPVRVWPRLTRAFSTALSRPSAVR